MVEIGDLVEIKTDKESLKGILMPISKGQEDTTVIKLDSGYNVGILNSRIKSKKLLEKKKSMPEAKIVSKENKKLPTIAILHTGGTIASKIDYKTGGVIAKFTDAEMFNLFPELQTIANIESKQVVRLQSEMIRFPHYNKLANEIKSVANKVDGVIITHGTDTMHYTSAALSFMLQDLPIPVLLVGSQRSSDRPSSDAALNLISAAYFIANSDFSGVGICMHENLSDNSCLILPGLKVRKMHTTRRDAFRPINARAIARINHKERKIEFISSYVKKDKNRKLKHTSINEKLKVGIIKGHTNMFAEQYLNYKNWDGLVLEATALGHVQNEEVDEFTKENAKIHNALKEVINSGTVVVDSSQCIYGRLQLEVYTPLREIKELGVLGHLSDMTPETSFIKLVWLLSNYSKTQVKDLFEKNLIGEISEKIEPDMFLN